MEWNGMRRRAIVGGALQMLLLLLLMEKKRTRGGQRSPGVQHFLKTYKQEDRWI